MVELDAFLATGYARIERAVPRAVADDARNRLWRQLGASPDGPWTEPVRWAADLTGDGSFGELVASPALAAALDRICGIGRWRPRGSLGNVPVRFPVPPTADDRGWHVDANTPGADGSWSVSGRPHTVLLLTLLSDVGPDDAPTRIRAGSHRDVARELGADPLDPFAGVPSSTRRARADRCTVRRASRVTCTCCIRSPCTRPTSTGGTRRGSWRRRRSC